MSQHITVVDYNPLWPKKYEEEALLIKDILADNCVAIYHIGSTSVEGLAAKPIIDIMAAVQNLEKVDDAAEAFSKIGYEYLGEFGIAGRRYLRKGGDERTHQIHIFQTEDWNNIGRHLAFRDYMRTHKKERDEYAKIKKVLAQKFPYDIDGYCDGKEEFVRKIEKLALSQFDGTWDKMYLAARNVQKKREISPLVEAGGVSAAILTEKGNIYVGVCIDTACSLGMCAERNAVFGAYCKGYRKEDIIGLAIVADCSPIASPCGACRQVLSELVDLEMPIFLANKEKVEKHTIGELLPMVFIGESL